MAGAGALSDVSGCKWRLQPPRGPASIAWVTFPVVFTASPRCSSPSICKAIAKDDSRFARNSVRSQELKKTNASNEKSLPVKDNGTKLVKEGREDEIEVEEEIPWIQEKALDLVEFTGSVAQAIPGPRVGSSSFPWVLAVPVAYAGVTFLIALIRTLRKFNSPREKRKKLVNANAMLCKTIDAIFEKGDSFSESAVKQLALRIGFSVEEILRKYIRYALNEKPFKPTLVDNLIHLRTASMLDDSQVAEILNEISRRIVRDKGPVVLDMSGYSEKGFKKKLAVQTLFGKIFYLSEMMMLKSSEHTRLQKLGVWSPYKRWRIIQIPSLRTPDDHTHFERSHYCILFPSQNHP